MSQITAKTVHNIEIKSIKFNWILISYKIHIKHLNDNNNNNDDWRNEMVANFIRSEFKYIE